MTFIPPALRKELQKDAHARDDSLIGNLIKLREVFEENQHRGATRDGIADEAAPDMKRAKSTIRRKMWQIRDYPEERLRYWLSHGVSFDHLEWAGSHYQDAKREPIELLDLAAEENMTVEEMKDTFFPDIIPSPSVQFAQLLDRVVQFAQTLGWPKEKRERFEAELKSLVERYI